MNSENANEKETNNCFKDFWYTRIRFRFYIANSINTHLRLKISHSQQDFSHKINSNWIQQTKSGTKIYIFVVQIVALKLKSGEPLITLYTEQNNGVKYKP